ncbi:MAG: hypothetical protein QOH47_793 [Sphingomonadales bacterium]|jgi:hypothetical protein|nr:hypothetical protein [Sphingomonadales bacterium]
MRFSAEQLRDKALQALEEACTRSGREAVEQSAALRFALAYLGNDVADRAAFDAFWKAVTGGGDKGINPTMVHMLRKSNADQALRSIYLALGLERPPLT